MSSAARNLQIRSELAEDVLGTYIGRLSAAGARAEAAQKHSPSVHRLAVILWLNTELRNAGVDRARLFEYEADPSRLEALIDLNEQKLFALAEVEQRTRVHSAADDRTLLQS